MQLLWYCVNTLKILIITNDQGVITYQQKDMIWVLLWNFYASVQYTCDQLQALYTK